MTAKSTIVLVHGAWHGAWCWREFEPVLRERGFDVVAVELTSNGQVASEVGDLWSDVDLVRGTVAQQSGPVVLFGHSYGGVVVTEASAGLDNVTNLIFQSAFVPDLGGSLSSLTGGGVPPWMTISEDGLLSVASGWPTKLWYSDCSPAMAADAERRLRPQSAISFQQQVTRTGWSTIPTSYIVCTEDQGLAPDGQRDFAKRIGATVAEIPTGHSPFMSSPERLGTVVENLLA